MVNKCRFCGHDLSRPGALMVYTTVRYNSKTVEKNPYDPDIGLDMRITLEREEENFDYVACGMCGETVSGDDVEGIEFVWPHSPL